MKKFLTLLLASLLAAAFAGCATPAPTPVPTVAPTVAATAEPTAEPTVAPTEAPTAPEANLTDFLGYTVSLPAYPEKIVSLSPVNTEIIYALGLEDRLVGVDTVSDYPEEAKALPKVGEYYNPNLEAIAALKPDLVLAGNKLQKDIVDKVKGLGLNVAAVESTTYADTYKSIELVGKLTGVEDKAAALIAEMKAKEKAVLDAVKSAPGGKSVYFALSFVEGNWTCGPGSFPYEFIEMCGAKNITEGLPVSWVNLNMEELTAKNPDIILYAHDAGDPEQLKTTEGFKDLKAVKDGQVFIVNGSLCSRPGPRIVDGLREFAKAITGMEIKFPGE